MNEEVSLKELYRWSLKLKIPLNQRVLHRNISKVFCGPILEYSTNYFVVLSAYKDEMYENS